MLEFPRKYSATQILIASFVFLYLVLILPAPGMVTLFALDTKKVLSSYQIWRLLSYAWLHGSFFHLLLDSIPLWIFGKEVESLLGKKRTLQIFFLSVFAIGAALFSFSQFNQNVISIGASGSIMTFMTILAFTRPDFTPYQNFSPPVKYAFYVLLVSSTLSFLNHEPAVDTTNRALFAIYLCSLAGLYLLKMKYSFPIYITLIFLMLDFSGQLYNWTGVLLGTVIGIHYMKKNIHTTQPAPNKKP